jgi:hypothetical protein
LNSEKKAVSKVSKVSSAPISPMPPKLREIELDYMAGSNLKQLSEQKQITDKISKEFECRRDVEQAREMLS